MVMEAGKAALAGAVAGAGTEVRACVAIMSGFIYIHCCSYVLIAACESR